MFITLQAKLLSQLRHPNIVSYRDSFQDAKGFLHIVMNFCEGGDLYTKLKAHSKDGKILEETQVVEWFVQIAMALQVNSRLIWERLQSQLKHYRWFIISFCISISIT